MELEFVVVSTPIAFVHFGVVELPLVVFAMRLSTDLDFGLDEY